MRRFVCLPALAMGLLAISLVGACGGGSKGPRGAGAPVLLSEPAKWIDNDGDSVFSAGDELVFCFDRAVVAGANPPALDLVLGGGGGEVLVAATWTSGFEGDGTKLTLNVAAADVLLSGALAMGTTFNIAPGNTLANPVDATIGALPAAAAITSMGNIKDTGQVLAGGLAFAIQMADLDGDGDKDVILGTTSFNTIHINQGLNLGTFMTGTALTGEVSAETRGIGVGLIDSDAIPDFVAANSGVTKGNRVYLQTIPGVYGTTNTVHRDLLGASDSNGVAVAQGFFFPTWDSLMGGEIFVANNGVNMVYYADATGTFNGDGTLAGRPAPQAVGVAADTRAVVIGDLNQDGVEDVVICDDMGASAGVVTSYLVTPGAMVAATFTPTTLAGTLVAPRCLALCDVDEDTDLDIVVGYGSGNGMQIFLQTGVATGAFGLPFTYTGGSVLAITCTDVDGDGFDDIIQGRGAGEGIAVWINTGGAIFIDSRVRFPGTIHGLAQAGSQSNNPPLVPAPELFSGFDGKGAGDFVSAQAGGVNRVFTSAQK